MFIAFACLLAVDYYKCGYHFAVLSLVDLAVTNTGIDSTAKADTSEQPKPKSDR